MQLQKINLVLICAILIFTTINASAQNEYNQKHIEVALRMIGHRVLLKSNDSTSRVLPIEHEKNVFTISFQNAFVLQPEDLIAITTEELRNADIGKGFIVEVKECSSNKVVYSYEKGDLNQNDILPCQSRQLALACYTIDLSIQGLTSQQVEIAQNKTPISNFAIPFFIVLIGGVSGFYFWRKKQPLEVDFDTSIIKLGKFQFNILTSTLTNGNQVEELTGKEAELLKLLIENKNETIERDVILQKVWGDEGDYIGRTLDVFISKLRKRLEDDESIKITNVRGVGYKLVVDTK